MRTPGWTLALALALGACGTDAPEPTSPPEAPVEEPELVTPEPEPVDEIAAQDFAIPEDFEEEAARDITAENIEAELASLEAELNE